MRGKSYQRISVDCLTSKGRPRPRQDALPDVAWDYGSGQLWGITSTFQMWRSHVGFTEGMSLLRRDNVPILFSKDEGW